MNPYVYLAQVGIPIIGAGINLVVGATKPRLRPAFAITVGTITAVVAIMALTMVGDNAGFVIKWQGTLNEFSLLPDGLSAYIATAAAVLGWLILIYSHKYMEHEEGLTRYYSLVLLFIGAMIGLVTTDNLLVMYFFWETVGICSYSLIGFDLHNPNAVKAGLKAFITTRIGDVGLLTGIMVLYHSTTPNTFNMFEIIKAASSGQIPQHALTIAGFGFLLGAVGKSAQVPLHVWLPDAMEAPTSVSALIHAATMVNAGVYLMARTYPLFHTINGWTTAVTWIGAITAFLAALMALFANDLKRMLAYSTVSQLGYMMLGIGAGGLLASQFHLLSHAIFKALLFLCAGAVIHEVHTRDMGEMGGLRLRMPVTGGCYLVGVLALSGVPIFNGFWSKDMLFASALHSGRVVPLALAVITAIMTVTYSIKSYLKVFCGEIAPVCAEARETPASMKLPLMVLAFGAASSWLIIGNYTRALHRTGLVHETIGVADLIKETFFSTAFLLSLFALIMGGLAVVQSGRPAETPQTPSIIATWARRGFGFDAFYVTIFNVSYSVIRWALNFYDISIVEGLQVRGRRALRSIEESLSFFDSDVIEGLGKMLISVTLKTGDLLKKSNVGDLNANLLKIVVGIAMVIVIVYVKRG